MSKAVGQVEFFKEKLWTAHYDWRAFSTSEAFDVAALFFDLFTRILPSGDGDITVHVSTTNIPQWSIQSIALYGNHRAIQVSVTKAKLDNGVSQVVIKEGF